MDFFADSDESTPAPPGTQEEEKWKVAIIDDEPEVHQVTHLALKSLELDGKGLEFMSAYTGEEGFELIQNNPDVAVVFVDVVMETDDAGLVLIERIRNEIKNTACRLILRTGQPGQAPEESVIRDYDINDYKAKTELTSIKLKSCIYTALRSYRDIKIIEQSQQGMEKVISSSTSVLQSQTLNKFGSVVLDQTLRLLNLESPALYLTSHYHDLYDDEHIHVLAATGELVEINNDSCINAIPDDVKAHIKQAFEEKKSFILDNIFVGFYYTGGDTTSVLYLRHNITLTALQIRILELYAANVALVFENLNNKEDILQTQKELILVMGDAIEARSKETGAHVRRVSRMCERMARALRMDDNFIDTLRHAAPLHDIGKIAIPESILHKPGKLDPQEWEVMQSHAIRGHELLADSNKIIAKMGARIALTHHERWDGKGYPNGIKETEIPIEGRIMAIVDVIDALLSKRCYKEPWPVDDVKDYVRSQSGLQFDPALCDLCITLFDDFLAIRKELPDEPH